MDRLRLIETFLVVARARSFRAAADTLGVSRANVTKEVAALETLMKAQLLTRSTHSVNLTEAGLSLLEDGDRLIRDFEALEYKMLTGLADPRGVVRIGTPPSFGAFHLVPAIKAFKREYPDIRIVLTNDDGFLDIIRSGLDFSIRIAHSLRDTSLVSRLLARVPQVLVASPDYLNRRGVPATPDDLEAHNCLVHAVKSPTSIWRFREGNDLLQVRVGGSLASNFGEAIRSAALIGEGIAMHPTYMVNDDIRAGRLMLVLEHLEPVSLEIRAVYVRREMPARVSLFLSFLQRWMKQDGRWLRSCDHIDSSGEESAAIETEP